jgi:endonuclease/exonuclease/phosphatase family metal-dependent hydrolase
LFPTGLILTLVGIHLSLLSNYVSSSAPASDGSWKNSVAFLALGPWLLLQSLIFQNTGLYGSVSGYEAPLAGFILLAVNGIAIYFLPTLLAQFTRIYYLLILFSILLIALIQIPDSSGLLALSWLLIGQLVSYTFGYAILHAASTPSANQGLARTSTMHGIGQILFVLLLFVYYAAYDISFGIRSGVILLVAAAIVFLALLPARTSITTKSTQSATLLALLLVIFPLYNLLTSSAPPAPNPPSSQVRVMDYNLHNAVNTSGSLDPEALAQVIEDSGADIIAFQEFSRGWLTWGGLDMLSWYADRLNMHYVWNPTADAQWGNALFSRFPIESYDLLELPPEDVLLLRGHINAQIDLGDNSLNVIATHFSHRDDQGPERLLQSSAILSTWNNRPSTVVMGDLNAEPDTEEILLLTDNGLVDISAEIGQQPTYTYYADDPDHQIDYILVSPDLDYSHFDIVQTSASDHLPLVATIHFGQ